MYFMGRSGPAPLRQHKEIFMPLLFISRERLIRFQKCLKFIYVPEKTISSAWSNVCSITRLECMRISQHIFWKWPFRMSNDGGRNITLHLTHIHEPRGGVTGFISLLYAPNGWCWTNIWLQVLHRLEERLGQLLWHRSSGGHHFHQRPAGPREHRPAQRLRRSNQAK